MNAVILDAAVGRGELGNAVGPSVEASLRGRGYAVARHDLAALEIPPCRGDFGCWTVTPGACVHAGPHREVATGLARASLAVWLTPVTFGGHASHLKKMLDHCIPLVSPLMIAVDGETHHPQRYASARSVLAIGLAARADDEPARVFERVSARNALNFGAGRFGCAVATPAELPRLGAWIERRLDALATSDRARAGGAPLDLRPLPGLPATAPRRAALLVGSPRGRASVSFGLASHLRGALEARGVEVSTTDLHGEVAADPALRRLGAALPEVELVALVSPVYVDALPAPVTRALEVLAPALARAGRRPRFLSIVNCGFPEPVHTDTALAISRCFAREAGLDWIGGLGVCGGGMLYGAPLEEQGFRGRAARGALDATADAVARGGVVPPAAFERVRRLPVPAWLYRRIADAGFRRDARRRGVRLDARPDA